MNESHSDSPSALLLETLGLSDTSNHPTPTMLRCQDCTHDFCYAQTFAPHVFSYRDGRPGYDQWCLVLSCGEGHHWRVCRTCHTKVLRVGRHHSNHHMNDPVYSCPVDEDGRESFLSEADGHDSFPLGNDGESQPRGDEGDTGGGDMSVSPGPEEPYLFKAEKNSQYESLDGVSLLPPDITIERPASSKYFESQLLGNNGRELLVAGAFQQLAHPTIPAGKKETLYHLKCTKFLLSLTESQHEEYADLLQS